MAVSMNMSIIVGNLTKDPDFAYLDSGTARASFFVAVNSYFSKKNGDRQPEVTFIPVVAWGRSAEVCGEYLKKGSAVLVEGRLKSSQWEGDDGRKNFRLEVIANRVQFLNSRSEGGRGEEEGSEESFSAVGATAQGDAGAAPDMDVPF